MTLPLPLMNNLCKRWNLPPQVKAGCDYYFVRNIPDIEFAQIVQAGEEPGQLFIQEFGVNFQVIFMYESLEVYVKNGELEKRKEPNTTSYWCSFRSITFQFNGKDCTKSYVLVQVDKAARASAEGAPRVLTEKSLREPSSTYSPSSKILLNKASPVDFTKHPTYVDLNPRTNPNWEKDFEKIQFYGDTSKPRTFTSFAERSQPEEKSEED